MQRKLWLACAFGNKQVVRLPCVSDAPRDALGMSLGCTCNDALAETMLFQYCSTRIRLVFASLQLIANALASQAATEHLLTMALKITLQQSNLRKNTIVSAKLRTKQRCEHNLVTLSHLENHTTARQSRKNHDCEGKSQTKTRL